MKKIAVLLILCVFATEMVNAQRREVRRANRNLNRGNLTEALEHIKNASKDESTKEDPETWILKSRVYMEFSMTQEEEYKGKVENSLDKAYKAIQKAQELDKDNMNLLDINQTMLVLSELFFDYGAVAYNESQFLQASEYFQTSYQVSQAIDVMDTTTLFYAAITAEFGGEPDMAYDMFLITHEYEYEEPTIYSSLSRIELNRGNVDKAVEWINIGRNRFEEDLDLIFWEANVHLTTGNIEEARRVLQLAIDKDPENANLHYVFGVNYDNMSKDTIYSKEEREFAFKEAVKAYERAIELQPDYFDAVYNLGALYFNEGIKYFVEADNILRQGYTNENLAKAGKLEEKSKAIWADKAQPYLEEAKELIDENDENYEIVIRSLRELYMRTDQREKLEKVNKIWEERFAVPEEE